MNLIEWESCFLLQVPFQQVFLLWLLNYFFFFFWLTGIYILNTAKQITK